MEYQVNLQFESKLGSQLLQIRKLIKVTEENVIFDFSSVNFLSPLIAAYLTIKYSTASHNQFINLSSYQKDLFFPNGLESKNVSFLKNYLKEDYLPLIKFNTERNPELTILRERILSTAGDIITKGFSLNHKTGLVYIISELTDNIVDHAKTGFGVITYSRFSEYNYLDICIADGGIGVIGAYQQYKISDKYSFIDNSVIALDSLIKGFST